MRETAVTGPSSCSQHSRSSDEAPRNELPGASSEDLEQLVPVVYHELRELAQRYLRQERRGHTLQPTALIHEAYLKLSRHSELRWNDRHHFVGIAARAMRQVLINHAEGRRAAKRGGGWSRVELDHVVRIFEDHSTDVLALNEALEQLAEIDAQLAQIVELRFFGGLTVEEAATTLGIPKRTLERDWATARAWLHRELTTPRTSTSPSTENKSHAEATVAAREGAISRCA